MRLTQQVHQILQDAVREGSTVIDATAGNGYDTLFLAQRVGPSGKVIAIDIQPAAIESTRSRLEVANADSQCELIEGDHAQVLHELTEEQAGSVAAITFNLGYLPGSDKSLTTSSASTLRALDAAGQLLSAGGVLLVTAYRGHQGGLSEARAVESWMQQLPNMTWSIEAREPERKSNKRIPPILWIARRKMEPQPSQQ
jgi:predicted methyltransferase